MAVPFPIRMDRPELARETSATGFPPTDMSQPNSAQSREDPARLLTHRDYTFLSFVLAPTAFPQAIIRHLRNSKL